MLPCIRAQNTATLVAKAAQQCNAPHCCEIHADTLVTVVSPYTQSQNLATAVANPLAAHTTLLDFHADTLGPAVPYLLPVAEYGDSSGQSRIAVACTSLLEVHAERRNGGIENIRLASQNLATGALEAEDQ